MENLLEGVVVTIIGITIVMTVLCLIALTLNLFKYIDKDKKKSEHKIEPLEVIPVLETEVNQKQEADDLELIAVITAVIAESMNTTADSLVVRSFRRTSAWNEEAIHEQQKSNLF